MSYQTYPEAQARLLTDWLVLAVLLSAIALVLLFAPVLPAQEKVDMLRIGTSGTLSGGAPGPKEVAAIETLKDFIKDETGLNNDIARQNSWRELADRMAKGELHLGVFQGYEFAWAQEKHPGLKPLAVAVNVYKYPVAYVVTNKDGGAKDFSGLKGQSLALSPAGGRYLKLFVDQQARAAGGEAGAFFSKVTAPDTVEDALDDVVDGAAQAVAADRAALEAYKRRKPGRFAKLKAVATSQPLPPTVVAYHGNTLDDATLDRFREGLVSASRKERGETTLTLFRLTGFEPAPADFPKVLEQTRKAFPPVEVASK
jgi:ABC-type phosphate/phosphonate transport system substrate-binding protein